MAAHRWDTEPAQILPTRFALRRRREQRMPGLPEAASGRLDSPHTRGHRPLGTRPEGTPSGPILLSSSTGGAAENVEYEPAGQLAASPRRWRFPLRAAALFACLLLAAAVAILLLQIRAPHESIAVDLGAGVNTAEDRAAADAVLSQSSPDQHGQDRSANPAPDRALNPGAAAPPGSTAQGPEDGAANGLELVVHVAGAVAAPGIVRIKSGGRVADAVGAAGGALPEADLTQVNLAAPMDDGGMVVIPAVGSAVPGPAGVSGAAGRAGQGSISGLGGPSAGGHPAGSVSGAGETAAGPVNLNTATEAELQTLPRVGPVLAARIVAWRTDHGRFTRPEDLDAVPGIGEAMLAALVPLVTV